VLAGGFPGSVPLIFRQRVRRLVLCCVPELERGRFPAKGLWPFMLGIATLMPVYSGGERWL